MDKRPTTTEINKDAQAAHLMSNNGNMNPLDQELILKLVLSHVGEFEKYDTDTGHEPDDYAAAVAIATEDLKNCRLVSHMWNRIAIKVLEEKMITAMHLDSEERVQEFQSLLWKTRCSTRSANNTELHHRLLASVQISVEVKTCGEIKEVAQLLVWNPHLRVHEIDLYYEDYDYSYDKEQPLLLESIPSPTLNQALLTLFRQSSRTLTFFTCTNNAEAPPRSQEFDFDAYYSEVEFPNLYCVHYHHVKFFQNGMMVDFTRHVAFILKYAPNLADLRLRLCHEEEDTEVAQAAALQLRLMLQACAPTLTHFTLHGSIHEESNRTMFEIGLAEVIFPKLESLELKYADQFLRNGLSEFMVNNCPCLLSTTVTWDSLFIENEHDEDEEANVRVWISGHCGHCSTKLSFYPDLFYAEFPRFLDYLDHVNQMLMVVAKVYSSKTAMKIYLELLFMLVEHLKQRLELEDGQPPPPLLPLLLATHYPILGNITTLKVRFNSKQENNLFKNNLNELATQLYHHVFPNLKTLVIKPNWVSSYYSATTCENRILRAIRFLCNHPGIQNLEIRNFATNIWLQHIGAESGDDELSLFANGLKSLKLQLEVSKARPPRVKLMSILSQFPSLEFLQFEEKVVSRDEIKVVRAAMSTVNKFD